MTADRFDNAGNPYRTPTHAPGTTEALKHGCTCVEVDGLFGREWETIGCPLHDVRRRQAEERVPW